MMLRYTFNQEAGGAQRIERAVKKVLGPGLSHRRHLRAGHEAVGTREMGDACARGAVICARLKRFFEERLD